MFKTFVSKAFKIVLYVFTSRPQLECTRCRMRIPIFLGMGGILAVCLPFYLPKYGYYKNIPVWIYIRLPGAWGHPVILSVSHIQLLAPSRW